MGKGMKGSRKQWWAFGSVVTGLAAGIIAVEYLSPPGKPTAVDFNEKVSDEEAEVRIESDEARDLLINQVDPVR